MSPTRTTATIMNRTFVIQWPSEGREKNSDFVRIVTSICHEQKHLFLEGYRHGRETRKRLTEEEGIIFEYWDDCPNVSHCYNVDIVEENILKIRICPSTVGISKRYTPKELNQITQSFEMKIIEEILEKNPNVEIISTSDTE